MQPERQLCLIGRAVKNRCTYVSTDRPFMGGDRVELAPGIWRWRVDYEVWRRCDAVKVRREGAEFCSSHDPVTKAIQKARRQERRDRSLAQLALTRNIAQWQILEGEYGRVRDRLNRMASGYFG